VKRAYFYKGPDGKLRKNYFCEFCGSGPYPADQKDEGTFFNRGSDDHPTMTCRKCDIRKFPSQERREITAKGKLMMSEMLEVEKSLV
jgi:hypothetical protein